MQRPMMLSTVLTGQGLESQKFASISSAYRRSNSRASAQLLPRAERIMRPISAGISLAATLMSPCAPTPMEARARLSSPEKTLKPRGSV